MFVACRNTLLLTVCLISQTVVFGASLVDYSTVFDKAKQQKIVLSNQQVKTVNLNLYVNNVTILAPGEKRTVTSEGGFVLEDVSSAGKSLIVKKLELKNFKNTTYYQSLKEVLHVVLNPNESFSYEIQWPSCISGVGVSTAGMVVGDSLSSLNWDVNSDVIHAAIGVTIDGAIINRRYVSDPADLSHQEKLYKKYFISGAAAGSDVWADFTSQSSGVTAIKRTEEVIISLTSYPARFDTTWLAIESLLRQEEKPDRIVLNLFEGEFPGHVLPWFIQQLMKRGLEINWCPENLKVYLKVIPTIQKFPNAAVVAVDDDVIYPKDRLKNLIAGYKKHPDCVICSDMRIIESTSDTILPVSAWTFTGWFANSAEYAPRSDAIPEGVWGVLLPPHTYYSEYTRKDLFFNLCPTDDDLWMYVMILLGKKKVFKVARQYPLQNVDGSQEVETTLWRTNIVNRSEKLTECFGKIYNHYNLGSFFDQKKCAQDIYDIKSKINRSLMSFDRMLDIRSIDKDLLMPIDLIKSFGWTEPGGIWCLNAGGTFRIYRPTPFNSIYKVVLKGSPYINPNKGFARFKMRSEDADEDLSFSTVKKGGTSNLTFFIEFTSDDSVISLYCLDSAKPMDCERNSSDFRELGIYISEFGIFTPNHQKMIDIGGHNNFNMPLCFGDGFYEPEETGVWSSEKSTFTLLFPQKGVNYQIQINYDARTSKENPLVSFLLEDNDHLLSKTGVILHNQQKDKLEFSYMPKSEIVKFNLLVENATRPCDFSDSQDSRVLGLFMKSLEIEKS